MAATTVLERRSSVIQAVITLTGIGSATIMATRTLTPFAVSARKIKTPL